MAQARERLVRVVVYDFTDKLLEEARITLGSRDPAEKGAYELRRSATSRWIPRASTPS